MADGIDDVYYSCIVARSKDNLERVAATCRTLLPDEAVSPNKILTYAGDICSPEDMVAVRELIVRGTSTAVGDQRTRLTSRRLRRMARSRHPSRRLRPLFHPDPPRGFVRSAEPGCISFRSNQATPQVRGAGGKCVRGEPAGEEGIAGIGQGDEAFGGCQYGRSSCQRSRIREFPSCACFPASNHSYRRHSFLF